MGYLRFIRVATCCIVIQMALLTLAQPTSNAKEVEEEVVIIKEVESDPDTQEIEDKTYHKKATRSEDVKTKHGKRLEDAVSTVDSEKHHEQKTLNSENDIGAQTKISSKTTSREDSKDDLKLTITEGTAKKNAVERSTGKKNSTLTRESLTQETDNGQIYHETADRVSEDHKTRDARKQQSEDNHGQICTSHEKRDATDHSKVYRNEYIHDTPDNYEAAENVDTLVDHTVDRVQNKACRCIDATPEGRTLAVGQVSRNVKTTTSTQQHEANIEHRTPVHTLYVNDISTQQKELESTNWKDNLITKTISKNDGTTVEIERVDGKLDTETQKHSNRFTLDTVENKKNAQPITVTAQTDIVDKDAYKSEEIRKYEKKNVKNDGSKRTENIVEVKTDKYDMHTLEPPKTGKGTIAVDAETVKETKNEKGK